MIQRIQTVYLLLAEILIGLLVFVPFGEISAKDGNLYRVDLQAIYLQGTTRNELFEHNWFILILWVACLIAIFYAIFMFKNRKKQIRISIINALLSLILSGLIFFKVWTAANQLAGHYSLTLYLVFPVIAAILIYLAIKAIEKDELLVRSIDRIR
jgi:hypothetical protein